MANTYTQIHLQLVFAVKYRASLISIDWEDELYKYITGIIQNKKHKLLQINGMPDHIHILIGYRPSEALPALIADVKSQSTKWINEHKLVKGKFQWQDGYGAFSYRKSDIPSIIEYIKKQKEHHYNHQLTFREEYLQILKEFEIDYNEDYIFKALE